jgi:signal transduction histidine kinase
VRYVQRMTGRRIGDLARARWYELLIGALGSAAMFELVIGYDSPGGPSVSLRFAVFAVALLISPLFVQRRFPFAAPAAYWFIAVALSFVDGVLIPFMVSLFPIGLVAAFLLGNVRDARRAWAGLLIVLGGITTVVYNIPGHLTAELIVIPVDFGISWAAGYALRHRAEAAEAAEFRAREAERNREAAARIAVAEERARVARELHDVVAHAVSVMVLQVGAVRHKLPVELEEDRDALRGVERAGRNALSEMRQLLAAMRPDGDEAELGPQPGLDRLDFLIEEVGLAGLPVELHVDGDPVPLPRGVELSAYRIVQEGLTNVLKHARATDADVTVRYLRDEVEIEVRDNGQGASASDGLGHGLVGMRERVKIYGGEMTVGASAGGGFVLSTRLPFNGNGS